MKICCLLPSAAEILYALDLADHIIGVSDLCQYPPEILKTKPIVSRSKIDPNTLTSQQVEAALTDLLQRGESPYQLDQQWLTDAAPDLIFTQDLCHICEIDANEVTQALQQTPIQPQIIVIQPRTYQDILDSITQIGQNLRRPPTRPRTGNIPNPTRQPHHTQTIAAANPRRPKVLSLEGINPLVAGGHWIPDLLQMAGGHLTSLKPGANAQRLTWQQIQTAAPEKLYIDLCSSDLPRHPTRNPLARRPTRLAPNPRRSQRRSLPDRPHPPKRPRPPRHHRPRNPRPANPPQPIPKPNPPQHRSQTNPPPHQHPPRKHSRLLPPPPSI